MTRKYCSITIMLLLIASCGTMEMASEENYRASRQEFIGNPIDSVVANFGHADSLSEAPNGNRLFVYSSSHTSTSPVNCETDFRGDEKCTGGDTSEHWCKTYFEVDESNTVVDFSYKGNSCATCKSESTVLCFPALPKLPTW